MKIAIFSFAFVSVYSAPNDQSTKLQKILSDASSKAINSLQSLADDNGLKVDVSGKANDMYSAGKGFLKSKQPEFDQWLKDSGYKQTFQSFLKDATKIKNKNKGRTPGQILDALTLKVNSLTKTNVENAAIRKNLVKLTQSLKDLSKKQVEGTDYDKKTKKLWKDAADSLEQQVNSALDSAQSTVDSY